MYSRLFQGLCATITFAVLCLATAGCSLLSSDLDRAAKGAGDLVTFYCTNIPSPEIREQFRAAVNAHAAPNAVMVTCANGGVPLVVTPENNGAALMPSKNPYEIARVAARNASIAWTTHVVAENRIMTGAMFDTQQQIITDQDTIIKQLHADIATLHTQLETSQHALANAQQELTTAFAVHARETHDTVNLHPIPETELGGAMIDMNEALAGSVPGTSLLT